MHRLPPLFSVLLALAAPLLRAQQPLVLRSPDGRIEVRVRAGERLSYDVLVGETVLLRDATLSLTIDGTTLGAPAKAVQSTTRSRDEYLQPVVRQKAAQLREHYNELHLDCDGGYAVTFRAYDEGVAWRFETSLPRAQVTVDSEQALFRFTQDHTVYYPEEQDFFSHNERHYLPRALGDLGAQDLGSLPAVVDTGSIKVAIAESDVEDYPGL